MLGEDFTRVAIWSMTSWDWPSFRRSSRSISKKRSDDRGKGTDLSLLAVLRLDYNNLSGRLPLFTDSVSEINLASNDFKGHIPASLATLPALASLILVSNKLTGQVPSDFVNSNLSALDLSNNLLSGQIPNVTSLNTVMLFMDLQYNDLTGALSKSLGLLHSVRGLYVNGNKLTGEIPAAFESLQSLLFLYMGFNRLSGSIPDKFAGLLSIQILNIKCNTRNPRILEFGEQSAHWQFVRRGQRSQPKESPTREQQLLLG